MKGEEVRGTSLRHGPRVTLAHDYLTETGGAERVAAALVGAFPEAPIITSAIRAECIDPIFRRARVRTTFLQRFASDKARQRAVFPLLPVAFRAARVPACDVLLSSSSGFAHHLRPPEGGVHVTYCHTPPRFLWDPDAYFLCRPRLHQALRPWLATLRALDLEAARHIDLFIANSAHTARRIKAVYGRDARVIHPPVTVRDFRPSTERSGRFLVVSRLIPYKRVDVAIAAAGLARVPLDIIGDGPDRARLERLADRGVRFLGRLPDERVRYEMARCTALLMAGEEDFGLTAVEAQASGRPPIALGAGGALESIDDGETGYLVRDGTARGFAAAMQRATSRDLEADRLVASARRFDGPRFESEVRAELEGALERRADLALRPVAVA